MGSNAMKEICHEVWNKKENTTINELHFIKLSFCNAAIFNFVKNVNKMWGIGTPEDLEEYLRHE